jgi:acyl carrier protein
MDKAALVEELKQLVITECDKEFEPSEMDADAALMNGPFDLDSLDALQIALAIKERYKVRIEGGPDGRKAFASLSALADFIIEARSASA